MKTKMQKSERDAEITLAGEAAYLDAKRRGESEDKALDELIDAEKAAAALGRVKSARKAKSSAENGLKGERPKKEKTEPNRI